MSALIYGRVTRARSTAESGTALSQNERSSGLGRYIDTLAALVPSEVLALHAVILSLVTKIEGNRTTIDPNMLVTLRWSFAGLVSLCVVMYLLGRGTERDRYDWVRGAIPPVAFVAWTMLQRATVFDALNVAMHEVPRTIVALFIAAILALVASKLPVVTKS